METSHALNALHCDREPSVAMQLDLIDEATWGWSRALFAQGLEMA